MYLISVTPFTKTLGINTLTYFSAEEIQPGLIVSIPLRKKNIKGLVIASENVKDSKQEIKNANYEIKKIKSVSRKPLLTKEFISAARKTADFFISSPGSIISSLIPKDILENFSKFQYQEKKEDRISKKVQEKMARKYILQSTDSERYSDYKSLIRSQFAKNHSVFFCVPTNEDTFYAEKYLTKGIEINSFVFNNQMTKKQIREKWEDVLKSEKNCLIIASGQFLSLPINNLGAIIIERENSNAYKTMSRPFFDLRFFAETLAKEKQISLILGDTLLRSETLWRYDSGEFVEYTPIKFRSLSTSHGEIIDVNNVEKNPTTSKDYLIISEQIKEMILKAHQKNERSFLFVSKKGLAPLIICGDCGEIVTCEDCSAPVVLYGKNATEKENFFKCHACGKIRSAGETCKKCGSWKLVELGIGTEKVQEKVAEFVGAENIFVLDKNTAKTPNAARLLIKKFLENPGGVLIGTEMVLLYLRESIEQVFILSIDSMFSIPDFQIKERILNILLHARDISSQKFIIQTRIPQNSIFNAAIRGNLSNFYREEFIERKKLNYPPFSIIIKISTASDNQNKLTQDFEALQQYFSPNELDYYPARIERIKGKYIMNGIIKISKKNWPNEQLASKLRKLPPQFKIEVDSQNII